MLMGNIGRKQGFLIGTVFGVVGASLLVYAVFNNRVLVEGEARGVAALLVNSYHPLNFA